MAPLSLAHITANRSVCVPSGRLCLRAHVHRQPDPDDDLKHFHDVNNNWVIDAIVDVFAVRHDYVFEYRDVVAWRCGHEDADGNSDVKLVADAYGDREPHSDEHSDAIPDSDPFCYPITQSGGVAIADIDPFVNDDILCDGKRHAYAIAVAGSDAQPSVFARHHELLDWHTGCVCCAFADHFVDAVGDPKYHCQWDDDPNGISGLDADFDAVG